ncbi:hypothetical protein [Frankia sp. ACN10a]|uniref:hypothetical protein n=1 Tax=Frankia sp. ACN10a TaxID=2926031 RepID=UPI002118A470|nr:hypothetical protein [Frankia sp. ACN10a]
MFFALLGAFGVLTFGALAGLWALGVAWIMIFGPPTFDRRVVHTYRQAARASLVDAGSAALRFLRSSGRSLGSSVRSAHRAGPQRAGQSDRAAKTGQATRSAGGFGAASVLRATRRRPADRSEQAAASGGQVTAAGGQVTAAGARADRAGTSG